MINYDYTYSGHKIKEETTENGATTGTRFYAGPFVFSSFSTTEPEWVNMPYVRLVYKDATAKWKPKIHLKDHTSASLSAGMGNTRMAILSDGTTTQENYYYPFGMLERSGNTARAGRISSLSTEPFNTSAPLSAGPWCRPQPLHLQREVGAKRKSRPSGRIQQRFRIELARLYPRIQADIIKIRPS